MNDDGDNPERRRDDRLDTDEKLGRVFFGGPGHGRLSRAAAVLVGVMFLLLRGFLMWFVAVASALLWPLVWLVLRLAGLHGVTLGKFLGWVDLRILTSMNRDLSGSFETEEEFQTVPFSQMATVTHRFSFLRDTW